jgi:hypothetical protein
MWHMKFQRRRKKNAKKYSATYFKLKILDGTIKILNKMVEW